jgi:hypothetical protein
MAYSAFTTEFGAIWDLLENFFFFFDISAYAIGLSFWGCLLMASEIILFNTFLLFALFNPPCLFFHVLLAYS